jgi:transglutaminase-like putative cysteine protease
MKQLTALLLLQVFSITLSAQARKFTVGKMPTWVKEQHINYEESALHQEAEDGYVDVDYELQVNLGEKAEYHKSVLKILTEAGVENASQVSVDFDPAYQKLIFHSINVIRDNHVANRLQPAKIKVIQQETELSKHMYNGSLTALLVLEDIRPNDIIEYSYTLTGFNPIFYNRFSIYLNTQFGSPVNNLYYKIIAPKSRKLNYQNSDKSATAPKLSDSGNETTYEWQFTNINAVRSESNTPSWYNPCSYILVTEFSGWADVSKWGAALFANPQSLSKELEECISKIQNTNISKEQQILAAIHFVQDNVRYMGIEIGANSHKPEDPTKIFARRFGDCKDKSNLLCTMLKALGVEALPVLINSNYKGAIKKEIGSPIAFNHVTVRLKFGDRYYWIDPTISLQRGKLSDISYPDYQQGLVLTDTTSDLTTIPIQNQGMCTIRETFTLFDMSGHAELKVQTINTGSYADDTRYMFRNKSISEIKKLTKDFYAAYYSNIKVDSLSFTDDEETGTLTMMEYYIIEDIWKVKEPNYKINLSPYLLCSILHKPSDEHRTMPFELPWPAKYKEIVEVNFPEDWNINTDENNLDCSVFNLNYKDKYFHRKYTMTYNYESLKDHVNPDEAEAFFSSYKSFDEKGSVSLTYTTTTGVAENKNSTASIYPKIYLSLSAIFIFGVLYRNHRRKKGY